MATDESVRTRTIAVVPCGESRSFPDGHGPFADTVAPDAADVLILIGEGAGVALATADTAGKAAVLVELGTECLGEYTGESRGLEGSNVLGFARFRLGDRAPSDLVEIVRQPATAENAVSAAREALEAAGLKTAVVNDFVGRVVDRLVRPYFNSALQALDEGLATADDLDITVRLGLGYPEGPIALLESSGLAHHYDVSRVLYEAYGEQALVPARRARVAKAASRRGGRASA